MSDEMLQRYLDAKARSNEARARAKKIDAPTGDPDWRNHVISTLKLRYDAVTTGELRLYRELMEQRGIPVPAWFTRIEWLIEKQKPIPTDMVPDTWDGSTLAGSRAIAMTTIDEARRDGITSILPGSINDDFYFARCHDCRTDTIVRVGPRPCCYLCEELEREQQALVPRLAAYDDAVKATRFHWPRTLRVSWYVIAMVAFWTIWWVWLIMAVGH